VKPFPTRARTWTLLVGAATVAALLLCDAPLPRGATELAPAHPQPAAPAVSTQAAAPGAQAPVTARAPDRAQPRATLGAPKARVSSALPAPAAALGAGGRIVALDPETGQLGEPSPEQLRALRTAAGIASVSRSEEGLVETRLTDGTVILDLGGRFQDHIVARLDRNGRLIYDCIHDDGKPVKATPDSVETSLEER
jgi:hypothetical protein